MSDEILKLADGRVVRLGRIRPDKNYLVGNYRALVFGDRRPVLVPRLAAAFNKVNVKVQPPPTLDYSTGQDAVVRRMFLNDRYGDCVIASKYHAEGLWTGVDTGKPVLGSDQEVLNEYHRICGPGDNGCIITDVLDSWMRDGLLFNGQRRKLGNYCSVSVDNQLLVKVALYLFGALSLGINLPSDWTSTDTDWADPKGRTVGGHDINAFGYDDYGVKCCTWGGRVRIKWSAFSRRDLIEECYAQIAPDWWNEDDMAPCGVSSSVLKEMFVTVGQGTIPDQPPAPPPPPPPPPPPVPTGNVLNLTTALSPGAYPLGGGMPPELQAAFDNLRAAKPADWLGALIAFLQALATLFGAGEGGRDAPILPPRRTPPWVG